jgi:hypothetical protein
LLSIHPSSPSRLRTCSRHVPPGRGHVRRTPGDVNPRSGGCGAGSSAGPFGFFRSPSRKVPAAARSPGAAPRRSPGESATPEAKADSRRERWRGSPLGAPSHSALPWPWDHPPRLRGAGALCSYAQAPHPSGLDSGTGRAAGVGARGRRDAPLAANPGPCRGHAHARARGPPAAPAPAHAPTAAARDAPSVPGAPCTA